MLEHRSNSMKVKERGGRGLHNNTDYKFGFINANT